MSWGLDIVVDHDDGYKSTFEVVDGFTYNLTPMWQLARVIEHTTKELHDRTAREMQPILLDALVDAWKRPDVYRLYNPVNGWGDYEGFLEILTRLTRLCVKHPTGVLKWNG